MKCIKCRENFVKNITNKVLIDYCPSCGLLFFNNKKEFEDVIYNSSNEDVSSLVAKGYEEEKNDKNRDFYSCPCCSGALYLFKFKKLYIAKCNRCGGVIITKDDLEYLINHRNLFSVIKLYFVMFFKWLSKWKISRFFSKKK